MKHPFFLAAGGILLLAAGCSLVRPRRAPGAPAEEGLRRFGGQVTMQGSELSAILEITGPDRNVEAALRIPELALSAQGSGRISGGHVDLRLSYPGSCPGTARIRGNMEREGQRIRGTITARDCTGQETGTVLLLRRSGGRPAPTGELHPLTLRHSGQPRSFHRGSAQGAPDRARSSAG